MIEGTELIGVTVSGDGKQLRLRVRDQAGKAVSLSLPACWLNDMLNALPCAAAGETVHSLGSWSMERTADGQTLVLTLRTPEGQSVSFALKPWHVEGMATIATYGAVDRSPAGTIH